jgi:hypothetical protein
MNDAKKLALLRRFAADGSGVTDAERATAKKLIAALEAKGVVVEPERKPPFIADDKWYRAGRTPDSDLDPQVFTQLLRVLFGEFMAFVQDDKLWTEFARKHGVESMASAPPKKRRKK